MMSFGEWVQKVLSQLVVRFRWDDPYTSLCPTYDSEARLFNALYDGYRQYMEQGKGGGRYMNPDQAAGVINQIFYGSGDGGFTG